MGIETGVDYLQGLQETWPLSNEILSLGDNHIRLLKHVLLYTFPGFVRPIDGRLIPMSTLLDAEDARTLQSVIAQMEADVSYLQDIFLENGTTDVMLRSNNLSDLADVAAARTNLGVSATTAVLLKADNLSGIADPAAARSVLNTPSMAEALLVASNLGDLNDVAIARANLGVSATGDVVLRASNLSDIANPAAARANLGVSATGEVLLRANDLSDLVNVALARGNLGVMSSAEVADAITAAVASVSSISDAPADGTYYARQDNLWVDVGSKIATDIATHSAATDPHGDRAYSDAQLAIAEAGVVAALATKQDTLVSGTNIKTVNGGSLLGSGDLTVGLQYHTETRNTTAPNATVPAHGFAATGAETNIDIILNPKGTGAILGQFPDSSTVGGNKRGARAVDLQRERTAANAVAEAEHSAILSGKNNRVSATRSYSLITGGEANLVVDAGAFTHCALVGGQSNNITNGSHVFLGGGQFNTARGYYGALVGGYSNQNQNDYGFVGGGHSVNNTGAYGVAVGGRSISAVGDHVFSGGGRSNTNQGSGSDRVLVGGSYNSNQNCSWAFLGGGTNNTLSGNYGGILTGNSCTANAQYAVVLGGQSSQATNSYAIAGGWSQLAQANYSLSLGGYNNTVANGGSYSAIIGGSSNYIANSYAIALAGISGLSRSIGSVVTGFGSFGTTGSSQEQRVGFRGTTTDATATNLVVMGGTLAAAQDTYALDDKERVCLDILVVGSDGTDEAFFWIKAAAKRGTGVGTTAIVGTPAVTSEKSAGASTWDATIVANTTYGGLQVRVTGEAAKTIRWTARVNGVEVVAP